MVIPVLCKWFESSIIHANAGLFVRSWRSSALLDEIHQHKTYRSHIIANKHHKHLYFIVNPQFIIANEVRSTEYCCLGCRCYCCYVCWCDLALPSATHQRQ